MKTKCPNCGATHSLDSLIMANKGGEAFLQAFDVPSELKTAIIQYLGLFRSAGRDLSFDRVAKLLAELNPVIKAGKVTFDRQTFDTPIPAWVWAIEQAIKARDDGRLTLPLKNHNWLYAVMRQFDPRKDAPAKTTNASPAYGQTVVFNGVKKSLLNGKTFQETWDIVSQANKGSGETMDETYERIKEQY
ncbi:MULTISPECIES: hypothetical protein [unclassified Moraxella]|uniref:hypothetical protein n=1 Tax=unclassified Moraxella TaxID=2685852 RepID=UPI003AF8956D